ncbi:hypothetical protein F8388_012622 [Cannabis sativa]|uniref:DUF599 domain-containing protein n=1 Tax=Cannabis sativa TaxID=3483 RepID=A0A7J6HCQ2_CANSA|nr:hypothetical protein F8388_012622 [Cannabis sativa]KAF4398201.1 hypothetical protein G4B88_009817 [Cannabis sativa]
MVKVPIEKAYLDVVLVPIGLLIMFVYHLFLLYRYINQPLATALGYENRDKRIWADKVMQAENKTEVQSAIAVVASNITAATYMSTLSLALCSLIGTWVVNSSSNKLIPNEIIYGNTKSTILSIKYICLVTCFLLAFSFFVQSARHFVHANYLISTPGQGMHLRNKVGAAVTRGGEFWSIGLRALYVALSLLLWFFGPIPMVVSSLLLVVMLYHHDFKKVNDDEKEWCE